MARCKACGAEIKWIKMKSGKSMPVDFEAYRFQLWNENEKPDTFITEDGDTVKGMPPVTKIGYRPHWSTCPAADNFRKR